MEIQKPSKAGRPKTMPDEAVKITITLYNEQIAWLDHLTADIRLNSMSIVDRGSMLRAIIGALQDSNLDLTKLKSEKEMRDLLLSIIKK